MCGKISDGITSVLERMQLRENSLVAKRDEKKTKILERRNDLLARLSDTRSKADDQREKHYDKMLERAATDAQKQAVEDFQAAAELAVDARRDAVDAANGQYNDGVAALLKSTNDSTAAAVKIFTDSVETAFAKAKTDCQAGKDAADIKSALQSSLQSTHAKFQSDRQAVEKIRSKIAELNQARQKAINQSWQDFRKAVEAARATLKEALKAAKPAETSSVPTSTPE